MKLIKSIEIGYFRSIYKQKLDNLTDMSILFGRNDSGKSNFLRALNLFFNGYTNPEQVFDFSRDFNHCRLDETNIRPDTRKRVYIKLTITTPRGFRPSLGNEFWVKKTWSVSRGVEYNIETSIRNQSKQQFVTKLLNKIQFHYIPAIKDRSIFENLLAQVYKVISQNEEFRSSLNEFTEELQRKTADISSGLLSEIGINSVIAPPDNLTDLFRSLDFETQNQFGDTYSLTLQKGDGIQVRHIPTILGFLSDKSTVDYHIWGFEEPENSLELASAVEEAQSFLRHSISTNKQIFLTSHSPAFFSMEDDVVKRFFVSKECPIVDSNKESSNVTLIKPNSNPSILMGETPHLPIISTYLKEVTKELDIVKQERESLVELINRGNSPILFLEGNSDKIILSHCWELFGNGSEIIIESCSGTTKMKSLSQDGKVLSSIGDGRKIFVLVDNDKEGRELGSSSRLQRNGGGNWVQNNSNKSYWCLLKYSENFKAKMTEIGISQSSYPYTIENCFSQEIHREAIEAGTLKFETLPHDELLYCDVSKKIAVQYACSEDHTYIRAPHKDYKIPFAQWIVKESIARPEILEPFREIIEGLVSNLITEEQN